MGHWIKEEIQMNTKQIDCVLELSNTLHFGRAAENLYISQPSLTYQVQSLEAEIGFPVFERTWKSVLLTPAGKQFCLRLQHIKKELQTAIEQGQSMNSHYTDALNLCVPLRSCLYFLPQIMRQFSEIMPATSLNLAFIYDNSRIDLFLRGEHDILFARDSELKRFPNVKMASLFDSHFYLIARHEDPISRSELITEEMLDGRTLLIGGDTPSELSLVHQRLIRRGKVEVLHSYNLNTTLSYIAAQKGICIAPGFTNDHNGEFAWIPFDCPERIRCVFGYHKNDRKESTRIFIELAQNAYQNTEKGQFL